MSIKTTLVSFIKNLGVRLFSPFKKRNQTEASEHEQGDTHAREPREPYIITQTKKHFRIAILTRSYGPVPQVVISSFVESLDKQAPGMFSHHLFDGKGDERLLFTYATQVVKSHITSYDAILAVGMQASQIATRVSLLFSSSIPIIFTCVKNPAHLGIIYAGENKKRSVSGITCAPESTTDHIETLLTVKKSAQSILMPYNPMGMFLKQTVFEYSQQLSLKGVEVIKVEVQQTENLLKKIEPYMQDIDTLITLRDDVTANGMNLIADLCNRYGITAYASDLESVNQGAALGFASSDKKMGIEAANHMYTLFKENIRPHELPITDVSLEYMVGFHEANLSKQGIHLTPEILEQIGAKVVYHSDEEEKERSRHVKK